MSRQGRLHGALRLSKGENILLDGPYGQYLELGKYETVILTAKGIGIAGILSSALILLERRRHDSAIKSQRAGISDPRLFRDATRKVALFWVLESVSQEDWIAPELTRLQRLDKDNAFLLVWCIYKSPEQDHKPFQVIPLYWECFYQVNEEKYLQSLISQDTQAAGRSIVITCGDADFTSVVRGVVSKRMRPDRIIHFVESEYRPHKSVSTAAAVA